MVRNVRQVCEGGLRGCLSIMLDAVRSQMSVPSLSNSPWMRGAPQMGVCMFSEGTARTKFAGRNAEQSQSGVGVRRERLWAGTRDQSVCVVDNGRRVPPLWGGCSAIEERPLREKAVKRASRVRHWMPTLKTLRAPGRRPVDGPGRLDLVYRLLLQGCGQPIDESVGQRADGRSIDMFLDRYDVVLLAVEKTRKSLEETTPRGLGR